MIPELEKELLKAVSSPDGEAQVGEITEQVMNDCLMKISAAVNPVNTISAPFVIASLRISADAMTARFPGVETVVSDLLKIGQSATIVIPKKRDDRK